MTNQNLGKMLEMGFTWADERGDEAGSVRNGVVWALTHSDRKINLIPGISRTLAADNPLPPPPAVFKRPLNCRSRVTLLPLLLLVYFSHLQQRSSTEGRSCDPHSRAIGLKASQYVNIDISWCSKFHVPTGAVVSQAQLSRSLTFTTNRNSLLIFCGEDGRHLKGDTADLLVDQRPYTHWCSWALAKDQQS